MARDPGAAERAVKHGAGAGEVAITKGADFSGMAQEEQARVMAELEMEGIDAIMRRDAIRYQTVSDLYFAAILGCTDIERLDMYVRRWGWITGHAMRAWRDVKDAEKAAGVKDVTEVLKALRSGDDAET